MYDNAGGNGSGDFSVHANRVLRIIGAVSQGVIAQDFAQPQKPIDGNGEVGIQMLCETGKTDVGPIALIRRSIGLGGAAEDV
jgi:hypothetical protein